MDPHSTVDHGMGGIMTTTARRPVYDVSLTVCYLDCTHWLLGPPPQINLRWTGAALARLDQAQLYYIILDLLDRTP